MATASKAKKDQPEIESPAEQILDLAVRIHSHYKKSGTGLRLTPALARELKELSLAAREYFVHRIAFVECLGADTSTQDKLNDVTKKIESLQGRDDLDEDGYAKLSGLERMRDDLTSKLEAKSEMSVQAETVLKMECDATNLPSLIGTESVSELVARVAKAIAPFCGQRPPLEVAKSLPVVADALHAASNCQRPYATGVASAKALVAFIESIYLST